MKLNENIEMCCDVSGIDSIDPEQEKKLISFFFALIRGNDSAIPLWFYEKQKKNKNKSKYRSKKNMEK